MKARLRALIRALPVRAALALLMAIGTLEWWLRPTRRVEAVERMALLLRDTPREREATRLARRSLRRSRGLAELLWREQASAGGRIDGAGALRALRAAGGGAVVAHTHICWIAPQVYALAAQGHADAVVMTIDDPPSPLQRHWRSVLERWGVEVIAAEGSFEAVLQRLRRGGLCHVALDVPGASRCTFLGKPASLASGIASLAFASGAPVVPVTARRPGPGLRVRVGEALAAPDFADPPALTARLAELASADILAAPELYHEHEWLPRLWPSAT